jgi:HTH-type transcriptional regulator, sugar sensing transcriptional regulator
MEVGLTEGEIRVYLALLEIGTSTAGKIIEKSKISPSKIYDVLNRLIDKGIVSYIIEGKTRHFKAAQPRNILNYIERREHELDRNKTDFKKILPLLEQKQKLEVKNFNAEIFEGINGLITVFDMSANELKKGDIAYAFGYPAYASELFDTYWREYYKKCDRKGIIRKVIYDYDAWFLKKRTGRKMSYYRHMPKGIVTPSWVLIFNDKVATSIVTPEQKVCFLVQNKDVAKSYLEYFNLLWKNAIEP